MEEKSDLKITDYFSPKSKQKLADSEGKSKCDIIPTPFLTPDSTPTKDRSSAIPAKTTESTTEAKAKTTTTSGEEAPSTSHEQEKSAKKDQSCGKDDQNSEKKMDKNPGKKKRGRPRGRGKKAQPKPEEEFPAVESKPEKTERKRKTKKEETPSHQLTEYFPVRRSDRKLKTDFEKQKKQLLEDAILSGSEDGLKVVDFEGKGRGVVSTKKFQRGDFVVEYAGELINLNEAKEKEEEYSAKPDIGCYMYYFKFNNKNYCIDATGESGRLGRLLNHSKSGNCKTKVVGIGDQPYLILVAARDISIGEELLYDYGDRSKAAIEAHPWLAK